jgi:hypothetical protein
MSSSASNENAMWLEAPPSIQGLAVSHSYTTIEELEAVAQEFKDFVTVMDDQWPEERVKQFFNGKKEGYIAELRANYDLVKKAIGDTELRNRDARVKGVSFKDRQHFAENLKLGDKLLKQIEESAKEMKAMQAESYNVRELMKPGDMSFIKEAGMEKHLAIRLFPMVIHNAVYCTLTL